MLSRPHTHTHTKQHFGIMADQNFYLSSDNLPELEPSLTSNNGPDSEFFNDIDGRCALCIFICNLLTTKASIRCCFGADRSTENVLTSLQLIQSGKI